MHLQTVTMQILDAELLNPGNIQVCATESIILMCVD